MKKTIKTLLIILLSLTILISFFIFSKTTMETISYSINIWLDNLFPSLFPFLILSSLFINYGISYLFSELLKPLVQKVLRLPKEAGFIIALSLLSGFPTNAKFIKNSLDKKELTENNAKLLLRYCYFPNPLFVVGTVGTLFLGDKKYGILLLITHYLASFIIAFCSRKEKAKDYTKLSLNTSFREIKKKVSTSKSFSSVLRKSIFESIETLILLLGIISCFLIISSLTFEIFNINSIAKIFISSALEMTQGLKNISLLQEPLLIRMILMSITLAFGGICIHTQIFSILEDYEFSYKDFLLFRIIHMILSFSLTIIFYYGFII